MNINHYLTIDPEVPSRADAVTTAQSFLSTWWKLQGLEAMLAPVEMQDGLISFQEVTSPDEMACVNPFAPIMLSNSATQIEGFISKHPGSRLAAMLRPCEFRTLVELQKRNRLPVYTRAQKESDHKIVIIAVDCSGTFSVEQYKQRVVQKGIRGLTLENLHYGTDCCKLSIPYRQACQVCTRLHPLGADIIIGSTGITTSQVTSPKGFLLIIANDERVDAACHLADVTDGIADEAQVVQRETAIGMISNYRMAKKRKLIQQMLFPHSMKAQEDEIDMYPDERHYQVPSPGWHPDGSPALSFLSFLARCTLCADCLDACPIYNGELTGMLGVQSSHRESGTAISSSGTSSGSTGVLRRPFLTELVDLSRWLASCPGCGMCQEACEHQVALGQIITVVSAQLQEDLNYVPGIPLEPLPW